MVYRLFFANVSFDEKYVPYEELPAFSSPAEPIFDDLVSPASLFLVLAAARPPTC